MILPKKSFSFTPGFSLGVGHGPLLGNRFNGFHHVS